jgi:hypothetical protein
MNVTEAKVAETVARRFRLDALERDSSSIAAISNDGRIGWLNPGWSRFACANGGAGAAIRVGDNYFAGISGEVRPFFEYAVEHCLASGAPRRVTGTKRACSPSAATVAAYGRIPKSRGTGCRPGWTDCPSE